ncbi:MAG: ParB/RepB/Spo0J family partition protein [Bacteroidales bacterium]|nr:ParB/RepB/Spo0J family partition protein [Bacteroidales bacterium]
MAKSSIGRGLDAILSSGATDITSKDISGNFVVGAIAAIPLKFIETNPFQPRDTFEEEALQQLAQSIKEQGVIQPITVRKLGYDKYQLISGERRFRASIIAGMETIPAYIRVADDHQMLEMAIIENIHREDLNAIEVALSYQRLVDECQMKLADIAQKVSQDRSTITNFIRLLKLPPKIQIAVRDKTISMGHARALINIDDETIQMTILEKIIQQNLSVRETESMAQQLQLQKITSNKSTSKEELPSKYQIIRDTFSDKLQTKVDLKRSRNGKGTITIRFKDDQQLENILSLIH